MKDASVQCEEKGQLTLQITKPAF